MSLHQRGRPRASAGLEWATPRSMTNHLFETSRPSSSAKACATTQDAADNCRKTNAPSSSALQHSAGPSAPL
eukprot:10402161-Alexandrium_andersonii.AAC.1